MIQSSIESSCSTSPDRKTKADRMKREKYEYVRGRNGEILSTTITYRRQETFLPANGLTDSINITHQNADVSVA